MLELCQCGHERSNGPPPGQFGYQYRIKLAGLGQPVVMVKGRAR